MNITSSWGYRGAAGRGCPGQRGAGPGWVHGAVLGDVECPVQVVHVHQRVQVLGLRRGQHVGLDTVHLAELEEEEAEAEEDLTSWIILIIIYLCIFLSSKIRFKKR